MSLLALFLMGAPAAAEPAETEGHELSGWVSPRWGLRVRPDARPEDQRELGMSMARFGLAITGAPIEHWSYRAYTVYGADSVDAVTAVGLVDADNDGRSDTVATSTVDVARTLVRDAWVQWQPIGAFSTRIGRMRIPFTSQAQSPDTELLFPDRAGPNSSFLEGTDLGALVSGQAPEDKVIARLGAFNGTGLGIGRTHSRGMLYAARIDVNPLGAFSFEESGPTREAFRVGAGAGVVWHPYTTFDSAGYADVEFKDLRASASIRAAMQGVHIIGEVLFHERQDSLSSRPQQSLGAYGQAGWYLPTGIEPVARLGWVEEDQTFFPRQTWWGEAGLNVYPDLEGERVDQLKLTIQYVGEFHVVEDEQAHGALAQAQLSF